MGSSSRQARHLAVIDPVLNDGGGGRFVRGLLIAMTQLRPELRITLYAPADRLVHAELVSEFLAAGIATKPIQAIRFRRGRIAGIPGSWKAMAALRRLLGNAPGWVPWWLSGNLEGELAEIAEGADAVYFSWPYGFGPPRTAKPMIATIHDLNFKYFFGTSYWPAGELTRMDQDIAAWAGRARIVTSSDFMRQEVAQFYPEAPATTVIRLAPFSRVSASTTADARARVARLGLAGPYVLYPTHPMAHKNLGPLIAAISILEGDWPDLTLVFTGIGTELATGRASTIGSIRGAASNVFGLGYVSNQDMDALIACAEVVVSTSLYEAGNGPGLDAWGLGVPVAMSDIPVFREHVDVQGLEAALFDPRSPASIADAIRSILEDPPAAREGAARSKHLMETSRSWADTASEYLHVIDEAVSTGNPSSGG
jgi:glycosyltransferase involved in cell wall biosynthesis